MSVGGSNQKDRKVRTERGQQRNRRQRGNASTAGSPQTGIHIRTSAEGDWTTGNATGLQSRIFQRQGFEVMAKRRMLRLPSSPGISRCVSDQSAS